MKNQTKIGIAAAIAVIFMIALISNTWSNHKIAKLESEIVKAKTVALENERTAAAIEIEAAEYKQKIDYLDAKLTEINKLARKQDEQLENHNNIRRTARSDADIARRTRTVTTTNTELCEKLAELGHPCR